MSPFRPHHALALLPAIGILLGVPFANRVHGYVLGLPFLLFWIVCCVVLTSVVMAVVGAIDRRAAPPDRPAPLRAADDRSDLGDRPAVPAAREDAS